jgi:hypothetical protein
MEACIDQVLVSFLHRSWFYYKVHGSRKWLPGDDDLLMIQILESLIPFFNLPSFKDKGF